MKRNNRRSSRNRSKSNSMSTNTALSLECLERRQLLSASLSRAGLWLITGDADKSDYDDEITLQNSPDDPDIYQAIVDGQIVDTQLSSDVKMIKVKAGRGNDEVTVTIENDEGICPIIIYGGSGSDYIRGGDGDEKIRGGRGKDTIYGGGGNDYLLGGRKGDLLIGEDGDDRIKGGNGPDVIKGGLGENELFGNSGKDSFYLDSETNEVRKSKTEIAISSSGLPGRIEIPAPDGPGQSQVDPTGEISGKLIDLAVEEWKWLFDNRYSPYIFYEDVFFSEVMTVAGNATNSSFSSDSYTSTNVQEAGVDESDFVKTDGEYLYMVQDQLLTIVDVWPIEEMSVVSQTELPEDAEMIYLQGDMLTVISSSSWYYFEPFPISISPIEILPIFAQDANITTGGCIPPGNYCPQVRVMTFDVSDPVNPDALRDTVIDGRLSSSRAMGNSIHLVIQNDWVERPLYSYDQDSGASYESEEAYRSRLGQALSELLPSYMTTVYDGDQSQEHSGLLIDFSKTYVPDQADTSGLLSIVTIDVTDESSDSLTTTSIAGFAGVVYASTESLYVVSSEWNSGSSFSHIYEFDMTVDGTSLGAVGTVPGRVLNQFSMDEYDGYFRIATTSGSWRNSSNNLFVLDENDGSLDIVGSITDLADGERIKSVRFMDETAYMVTFRQMDPLFSLDLSTPQNPLVTGELKIPGFSSYLHPANDDLLIGLGYDADERGWNRELQLSLFDTSDPGQPERIDSFVWDGQGPKASSEAIWDHHAFSYFQDYDIIALPVSEYGDDSADMVVFEIDPEEGLILQGSIEHKGSVRRSIRIDEMLLTISDDEISAHYLDDIAQEVGSVSIPEID